MKVVQILLSPRIGGAETLVSSLQHEFDNHGVENKTLFLDETDNRRSRLKRLINLRKKLKSIKPDLVLAHSYLPALYARMAWFSGVHYVLHSASDDYKSKSSRLIEYFQRLVTSSVIAVSDHQRQVYIGHFDNSVPSIVITNGVSSDFCVRDMKYRNPSVVTTVARVADQKRPLFWRKVAETALARGLELKFQWWGPLSGNNEIDGIVLGKLPPNAQYMGPTATASKVIDESDIIFHTSDREAGVSIAALEAACAGKPLVYANTIMPPEQGEEYWQNTYKAESPDDALESIQKVIANWDTSNLIAKKYGLNSFEKFGSGRVIKEYMKWLGLTKSSYSFKQ